jgi:hypothetical protein
MIRCYLYLLLRFPSSEKAFFLLFFIYGVFLSSEVIDEKGSGGFKLNELLSLKKVFGALILLSR